MTEARQLCAAGLSCNIKRKGFDIMGLRFRKSIKIAPGVRLNIGKSSLGISAGVKGFHKSINTNGRVTTSVSLPGTGLSYVDTKTMGKGRKNGGRTRAAARQTPHISVSTAAAPSPAPSTQKPASRPQKVKITSVVTDPPGIGTVVIGGVLLVGAFFASGFSWLFAALLGVLAVVYFWSYASWRRHPDNPAYITADQLVRWRSLLGVEDGQAYELGKKSLPLLLDLKAQVASAMESQDGPAVLAAQQKIVDFSEFVVIKGDHPTTDFEEYTALYMK